MSNGAHLDCVVIGYNELKMLEMEIALVPPAQKSKAQQEYLQSMVTMARAGGMLSDRLNLT
jgi:hypothetical protein